LAPQALVARNGHVAAVRFARSDGAGEHSFVADMVLKAIGQKLDSGWLEGSGLTLEGGRIVADDEGRTALPRLYAGGDCRRGGRDLTVEAVADGQRAAAAIDADLKH
ncbi:MAG: FAD-dependent oxidoreductase, partial [Burkholderiales bacterium]|nr:FAD-dependent oxidoreductase [Burkholderiales bacterium]